MRIVHSLRGLHNKHVCLRRCEAYVGYIDSSDTYTKLAQAALCVQLTQTAVSALLVHVVYIACAACTIRN